MPRRQYSIEKIHAELAWVNETPDPNKCGCRNVRCCEETGHPKGACAGIVATVFGPSGGCTTAQPAANTNGAEVKLAAIWSPDDRVRLFPVRAWALFPLRAASSL